MPSASNKYFDEPGSAPEHPRIRAWRSFKNNSSRVELEIRRQRDGFAYLPTRMFVTFHGADGCLPRLDETEWDLELDSWLVTEHVKAKDEDNEKLRFSLRLKAAFHPIAIRFGDGFFNSVLVHLLRDGPFASHQSLAQVLDEIHEYPAGGGSKGDCEELIEYELRVAAMELMGLHANRAVAEEILAGAVAQYLDDRFHITEGRLLGFR